MVGLNSRLDTLQAAVLGVKLPHLDAWAAARERHAQTYAEEIAARELGEQIIVPTVDKGCRHVWNQYTVRVSGGRRDALQKYLTERNIGSAIYYPVPLHLQECFASLGYRAGSLPNTEQASREVLSLPIYPELAPAEQRRVVDAIEQFCQNAWQASSARAVA